MAENTEKTELKLQKEFAERQRLLREYIADVERVPLIAIVPDPLRVHSLGEFRAAWFEEKTLRRIKRTLKRLAKMRRKNVNIGAIFKNIQGTKGNKLPEVGLEPVPRKKPVEEHGMFFRVAPQVGKKQDPFKETMDRVNKIKRYSIEPPPVLRNLNASASHSQFIKKIEKQEAGAPKTTSEITTAASIHNGVVKIVAPEKPSNQKNKHKSSNKGS